MSRAIKKIRGKMKSDIARLDPIIDPYLYPAQLVKHLLGLKEKFDKNKFRLLYLWYDTIGLESAKRHKEIEEVTKITKADGVYFHDMSYQDLIIKLSEEYRGTHKDYIDYISERYL
jgi:hypothetical protein